MREMGAMDAPISISAFDSLTAAFAREFIEAQNEIHVDAKFLARGLKKLARATKVDTFKAKFTSFEDGKPVSEEEKVIYSKRLADNPTQLKAHTLLLNSRGVNTSSPTHQTNIGQAGEVNIMGAVAEYLSAKGEDVDD